MKNKIAVLFTVLLLVGLSSLTAQNYISFPVGQFRQFPDARSLSLGGAGSVSLASPGAMLYNPAALTQIGSTVSAQFSLSSRKLEERRSFPLYDRFDSNVGDGIYAINNNWFLQPEGAVALRIPLSGLEGLTVAVGSFIEIDQDYRYDEEVRKNIFGDPLVAYNEVKYDGTLRRYAGAIAFQMPGVPKLALGFQAGLLDGSLKYLKQVNYIDTSRQDIVYSANRTLNNTPLHFSLGATYRANERITGGFHVFLPYTVEYSATDAAGNELMESIGYPLRLNAGFEYRARQELQARLNMDIGYEFWSSVDYTGVYDRTAVNNLTDQFGVLVPYTQDLSDVFSFKAGIEHIFFNRIPFRVGMQYRNSYQQRGNTSTLLSAGTGFFGQNWRVDAAAAFSKFSYSWPDLFDDTLFGGNRSNSPIDDVDEYYFFGKISLVYNLDF
ncbi:MAG TPA: hypothetical protein ENK14_13780 [Caldithrix sp.]|nr:hypothetical protein [Caldithrix sp.]